MTEKSPSTCPKCTAVLSGESSVCPYCGQELSKPEAPAAQPFELPAAPASTEAATPTPAASVSPAKPVDQVPEWLADDAEELAAKYGVKEEAKKQADAKAAAAGREAAAAAAAAVQAAQASQVATGKYKKSLGWGCLGGCVSYILFSVMCLFSAFVIEEVAFPGQWETLKSPFGVLAWIVPGLIGLAVLALITYLGRKKS